MSDLKQVLSDEIRRLARKEIKQAVQPLQATIVSLRRQISELKKLYSEANKKAENYQKQAAAAQGIELVDEETIDTINILNATKVGMLACIENLPIKPDVVLIDAVKINSDIETVSIIKGDALSYSIACASILAKVTRDRLMQEIDKEYPEYGFAKHKGYGTKLHIDALKKYISDVKFKAAENGYSLFEYELNAWS